jgi:hypothetical protein
MSRERNYFRCEPVCDIGSFRAVPGHHQYAFGVKVVECKWYVQRVTATDGTTERWRWPSEPVHPHWCLVGHTVFT